MNVAPSTEVHQETNVDYLRSGDGQDSHIYLLRRGAESAELMRNPHCGNWQACPAYRVTLCLRA